MIVYTPYQLRTGGLPVAQPNPYAAGSSEWWIYRLNQRLDYWRPYLDTLDAYYRGANDTFRLASTAAINSGIAALFRGINANLAKLVVDAPRHRLQVDGFRTGVDQDDERIWQVWQRNDMDGESDAAHKEALIMRGCPVIVEPDSSGQPRITPQDPRNCVVEHASGDRRVVRAAMKRWLDDDGRRFYTLYLPDRIERWQDRNPNSTQWTVQGADGEWTQLVYEPRTVDDVWSIANPLGEVPVVLVPNQGRTRGTFEAEHESVLPLLDLYNKTLLDMATTSEFGAFPQRYGIGVDMEEGERPTTEEGVEAAAGAAALARIQAAVDAMITTPSPDAQFGQFDAADLSNYVGALDAIRGNIGSITFTPFHLLLNMPTSTPATGEALRAAEVGLVSKVRSDHHREKGAAWERVVRLCFRLLDGTSQADAAARVIETVWRNPETLSEAQHMDALSKAAGLGVPQQALWEQYPASPAEVRRWQSMAPTAGRSITKEQADAVGALIRSGYQPAAALKAVGVTVEIEHTGLLPITLQTGAAEAAVGMAALEGEPLPDAPAPAPAGPPAPPAAPSTSSS